MTTDSTIPIQIGFLKIRLELIHVGRSHFASGESLVEIGEATKKIDLRYRYVII
nr:hypothetical protein Iba_chr02aCG3520 [Ipomoea batatas]